MVRFFSLAKSLSHEPHLNRVPVWTLQWFCQSFFLSVEYGQNLHVYFLTEGAGGWEGVEEDEDEAWAGGTEDEVTVADGADFLADRGGLVWEGNGMDTGKESCDWEDSDEAIAVEDGVITSGSIEDWDESWGVEVEDCVRRSGSIEDADE